MIGAPSYAQPGWKAPAVPRPGFVMPKAPVKKITYTDAQRQANDVALDRKKKVTYTDAERQANDIALDRRPAAPKAAPRPSTGSGGGGSSGGGGGSSGGGGGGGGGAVATAMMAAPEPVMETIVIPDAKADDQYQKTVADLARAKADFGAQQKLTRDQYDRQFGDAKRRMGFLKRDKASKFAEPVGLAAGAGSDEVWSLDPNEGAYGEALYVNGNDFVGRGVGRSGLFAQSQTNIGNDFTDRLNSLLKSRDESVDTQNVAMNAFAGQQEAADKSALQDAVNKIAAKYAIQLGEVPMGMEKTITREKVG